jgi:KRAB domain-containing zinc finger protein
MILQGLRDLKHVNSEDESNGLLSDIKQEAADEKGIHCFDSVDITGFKCVSCQFKTTSSVIFMDHLKIHSKEIYFKCSNCNEEFHNHWDIQEHIKTVHNPELHGSGTHAANSGTALTFYECNVCKFHSPDKTVFDIHVLKHNRAAVYKCSFCSKMLKSKSLLKKHMNSHRVFKCGLCNLTFKQRSSLLEHFVQHRISKALQANVAERPVGDTRNRDDDTLQLEGVQADGKQRCAEREEADEAPCLSEDPVLGKDGDDNLSVDLDKNEDSETNDFLIDPSDFLGDFKPGSQKQEENPGTDETKAEGSLLHCSSSDDMKTATATSLKKRVYVCSLCGLRAYTESHMKRHFKSHIAIEKKMYECHICNKVLTTRSNLNRHLSNHENCPGVVTCKLCNEELSDRLHLKQHLEDQHSGPQHCSFCNMEFTSKRAFKEHELTHPERALHQCDVCHKRFLTQLRLRTHLENIHNSPKDGETEDKIYKCHICSKILTTYHNLKRHVKNHEKSSGSVKCTLCSKELTDKLHLRQHVEEVHPETHQCPFCQKVFSNKKVCKAHELTHPERYVYKCDMCEKMFLSEMRLEKHKTVFHRDPHCRYCEKEVKDPTKLFNHERRHEMYKNKFPCELCPKVFRTPSGLKYHMSVHTGKYAVYCEVCGKGMHSEIVLEEHKATHTKEIRYTCELCGRNFSSNSTYRMHRKWHDDPMPYKCKICDRKFKHTSILAVHMRRAHTGERPYKCPHCPYTFSVSSTLHKHIILHTKKYPHNCKLCGKGFTTRTKIARHMAGVHNDYDMLNAKPTPCQYKMVLKPSELSRTDPENSVLKQEEQLPEPKFEPPVAQEDTVEPGQAIFLFQ